MTLKEETLLQGGKYRIIRVLGQGGFGITYEAEQVVLERKVAIKEFFMKECCQRDGTTSRIAIGTGRQRELIEKFRGKFIREAQMIAALDHPHIVHVIDVFEENETAYYVMENLSGGSLESLVKEKGPMSELNAIDYVCQVADALSLLHENRLVHLDVKPSNILLNRSGDAVLIDFGISKHYDSDGEQTSSTPVGISKGYAPLEQSRSGDVAQFTPATDIYALGATLYYLVTGLNPPDASVVCEDGLERPQGLSNRFWKAIERAMQPRRKDRPQSIESFLSILIDEVPCEIEESEETVILSKVHIPMEEPCNRHNKTKLYIALSIVIILLILGVSFAFSHYGGRFPQFKLASSDSLTVITPMSTDSQDVSVKSVETEVINVTNIELSKTTLELEVDGTSILTAIITPIYATDKTVIWKSNNEQVAIVSKSGKVTAKKVGSTTIVASCMNQEASCFVTVKDNCMPVQTHISQQSPSSEAIKVTGIKLSRTELDLEVDGMATLAAIITPSNATDNTITWKSSNEQVATVSMSGMVTAKMEGSATIVARCEDQEAYCIVAVKEIPAPSQTQFPQQTSTSVTTYDNGHEWVNLGLPSGTKWATCNVGASSPSGNGGYFAWGETTTKSVYDDSSLKYHLDGDGGHFIKYVPSNKPDNWSGRGSPDNKTHLEFSDDAARANWGGKWSIPTKAQWEELKDRCTWVWTGSGYRVTGPNGRSIILPAAGRRYGGSSLNVGSSGYYWASSLSIGDPGDAWNMFFNAENHYVCYYNRSLGFSVRPVTE